MLDDFSKGTPEFPPQIIKGQALCRLYSTRHARVMFCMIVEK